MRCQEPLYTSSLVGTIIMFMSGNRRPNKLQDTGEYSIIAQRTGEFLKNKMYIMTRYTEYLWSKYQGLVFSDNKPNKYTFWVGKTVQWETTSGMKGTRRQVWCFKRKTIRSNEVTNRWNKFMIKDTNKDREIWFNVIFHLNLKYNKIK